LQQLETAAFNKDTRRLVNVKIEDAIQANKITSLLMGNVVEGRKQLLMNQNHINIQHKNKSPIWGFILFNNVLVLKIIVKNYLHNHLQLIFDKILKYQ